ncbi:MAG: hypothetical protein ABL961_11480 [Vicinamibacterales bacterium]
MSTAPNWLEWQQAHTDALIALQDAQRVYHRVVSGHAFSADEAGAASATKDALRAVDSARLLLNEVRARQPR